MPLDSWQKTGVAGLLALGVGFAGFTGIQMARNQTAERGSEATVAVHVSGAVRNPGLVYLRHDQRVQDAINAAGGAGRGADLTSINLAEPVRDGMKVEIGNPDSLDGRIPPASSVSGGRPVQATRFSSARESGSEPVSASASSGPVHLNTATLADLDRLPGVGPAIAQRILDFRQQRGGFQRVEDLLEVKGIGPKTLEKIRPHVQL